MKQKEYCKPETEVIIWAPENILCVSKVDGNENEAFGNGNFGEVDW